MKKRGWDFRLLLLICLMLPALLPAAAPVCDVCGRTIRGKYLSGNGRTFCSETCWETTLPKCAACGAVVHGRFFRVKDRTYCSEACVRESLPKCGICRTPLEGKFMVLPVPGGRDRRLCMDCAALPRCFACGMPEQTTTLADGRRICAGCAAQRVTDAEAQRLFAEVRARLEYLLGSKTACPVHLRLVDKPELLRHLPPPSAGASEIELGCCQSRMDIRGRRGSRTVTRYQCMIFILTDLPRKIFIDTAAHELAHHWQYHRFPFLKGEPLRFREGFAEYAASLINIRYGQPEMNLRKERHTNPVYREGYLQYRELAANGGLTPVFLYMRRNSEP